MNSYNGLSKSEVIKSRNKYGSNKISTGKKK